LGVCAYHALGLVNKRFTIFGADVTSAWYYLQTGVHLFFVLSGFLLFLPYARAILRSAPLPSTKGFYERRALRILPAYWVCLATLVALHIGDYLSPAGLANVAAHVVFIQDYFPSFDRAIEGPMWTLALEAQFYLLLPLIAVGLSRVIGRSRSARRLVAAVVGFGALAIALRAVDAAGQHALPALAGTPALVAGVLLRATYGTQGKFLEVFAIGMLCAVVYVAAGEDHAATSRAIQVIGIALVGVGLAADIPLAMLASTRHIDAPWYRALNDPSDLAMLCGPALIGLTYGALLLGILWGARWLRGGFELRPLRTMGQISYSFYLWHGPALWGMLPAIGSWPLLLRPVAALGISGASYTLIERPFLRVRTRARDGIAAVNGLPTHAPMVARLGAALTHVRHVAQPANGAGGARRITRATPNTRSNNTSSHTRESRGETTPRPTTLSGTGTRNY
jgi:peptidoglycan/LPS O-acetylase OafA/YrhL